MNDPRRLAEAAVRLHRFLATHHWTGRALAGPDPGIRFNARVGRYVKSYTPMLPWRDTLVYAQAQKYWIASLWLLADLGLVDGAEARGMALAAGDYLHDAQRPEGYWAYPNPEWHWRIATVEGNYAALGLIECYARSGEPRYIEAARRWYAYAIDHIGFQVDGDYRAINYFGNFGTAMVPNNSASALRVFAVLAEATGDTAFLASCGGMATWLRAVQLPSGELPYGLASPARPGKGERIHFLCYQYNAFEFLNLVEYQGLTQDAEIAAVLPGLARFVASGMSPEGAMAYDCQHARPEVLYYGLSGAAALDLATELGLGDYRTTADTAYRRVLDRQRPGGAFAYHSQGAYGVLTERRAYPRYLAMMLYHLSLGYARAIHHAPSAPRPAQAANGWVPARPTADNREVVDVTA